MSGKGTLFDWTIREQLILASAVQRSGDQNWVSVSRAIKPLVEIDGRPPDYFSQKNCAQQYSAMLDKAGTHKRKRSTEGSAEMVETAGQQIVRELTEKYVKQLHQSVLKTREQYSSLKKQIEQVECGELDSQLPAMLEEIQKESAVAKAAAKSKSTPSSNLAKHQEQMKQKKSLLSSIVQVVEAEPVSPKGALAGESVVKQKLQVESDDVGTIQNSEVPGSDTPPTITSSAIFVSAPSSKLPLGVFIKKERLSTPSPMDVESPLPHITSTFMTSPKEEKFSVPMQTPLPSTHPGSGGEVHVIVQQPNIAALLKDDKLSKTPVSAAKPTTVQTPSVQKSLPALVLSGSTPATVQTPSVQKSLPALVLSGSTPATVQTPSVQKSLPALVLNGSTPATVQTPSVQKSLPSLVLSGSTPATVQTQKSLPSVQKSLPALVLSGSTPVLPSLVQSTVRASAAAVSVLKQPSVATSSSTPTISFPLAAPTISFPLAAPTISLTHTPPASTHSITPSNSSSLTAALTSSSCAITPVTGHTPAITALPASTSKPPASTITTSKLSTSASSLTSNRPPVSTPTSRPSLIASTGKPFSTPSANRQSLLASTGKPLSTSSANRPSLLASGSKLSFSAGPLVSLSSTKASMSVPADLTASVNKPSILTSKPVVTPTSRHSLPLATSRSSLFASTSRPSILTPTSHLSPSTPSPVTLSPSRPQLVRSVERGQPVLVKLEEKLPMLPFLVSSPPVPSALGVMRNTPALPTGKSLKLTTSPPIIYTVAPQAPPTITPVATLTTTVKPTNVPNLVPNLSTSLESQSILVQPRPGVGDAPNSKPEDKQQQHADVSKQVSVSTPPILGRSGVIKGEETTQLQLTKAVQPAGAPAAVMATAKHRQDIPTDPWVKMAPTPVSPPLAGSVTVHRKSEPVAMAAKLTASSQQLATVMEKLVKEKVEEDETAPSQTKEGSEERTEPISTSIEAETHQRLPSPDKGHKSTTSSLPQTPSGKAERKDTTYLATPLRSAEVVTPAMSTPEGGETMEDLDEETPVRLPAKISRSSLKKQWNTRSRKRKMPYDEGYSVESTDTEDDVISQNTSTVSSPAPSQSTEMDPESLQAHKQWKKAIIIVWRHAAQHKYANLFLHPVREEDAQGYKNVVLRPMDLSTIKKKIELGHIKADIEFQRDMLLMFQNAFMYNNSEHEVYYMAQEMKNDVMDNIQDYLATQVQLQLMEDSTPSKTLRSREGRLKDIYDEAMFSPAKKRRTRADD